MRYFNEELGKKLVVEFARRKEAEKQRLARNNYVAEFMFVALGELLVIGVVGFLATLYFS